MSVQRDRDRWRVRWREGGKQRSRSFDRKGDAQTFDREVKRRLQLGPHLVRELDRSALTLAEFVDGGFRSYAATLGQKSREQYDWALQLHLRELAGEPLLALDVPRLAIHQEFLLDHGRTPNTVRDAMTRLSGILQVAVEHGHVPGNAARALRKVPAPPREEVHPLSPVELEALIARFEGRARVITMLGGHLGLRPKEIRLVPWSNFDGASMTIGRARTKRGAARTRVIAVPRVTAHELKMWRLASGGRDEDPIVGQLGEAGLRLWSYKHFKPAVLQIAGREDATTYTLRHTHASALHYADFTVPEAARRMGHGPALHVQTYAHVIDAVKGKRYADLDELIQAARAELECRESAANSS
jgi:integrase